MPSPLLKAAVVGGWVVGLGAIGLVVPVQTAGGWIALGVAGVLPAIVLLRQWNRPPQTMSERIQKELK